MKQRMIGKGNIKRYRYAHSHSQSKVITKLGTYFSDMLMTWLVCTINPFPSFRMDIPINVTNTLWLNWIYCELIRKILCNFST